jgi:hypothetical protein
MSKKKTEKQEAERGRKLQGIDEIARHFGWGKTTVLKASRERGLPMAKVVGIWEAWSGHCDQWHEDQIWREVREAGRRMVG